MLPRAFFRSCSRRFPMSLNARIVADMKSAMKAKETDRLSAIRLLIAAIKQ